MVRLVGENLEPGIFNLRDAMALATSLELDLVEISPTANPPVCKIIDYKKVTVEQFYKNHPGGDIGKQKK